VITSALLVTVKSCNFDIIYSVLSDGIMFFILIANSFTLHGPHCTSCRNKFRKGSKISCIQREKLQHSNVQLFNHI